MKIEYVEKNYKISKKLKELTEEKLSRLDKYFGTDAKARVVAGKQNKQEKLEVTITNKGVIYRGEVLSDNMYANIDLALPKIERQIVRQNEKLKSISKKARIPFEFIDKKPEPLPEVIKKKSFDLAPVTVEDAKEMLDRLDHEFFVFLNVETGKVNILYKRKDNKLGLIEVNY